jgi:hypothetical protein
MGESQMTAERRAMAESVMDAAALGALASADGQTERAGVIASFVLNAAMIPGWPFPKPIELALGRGMIPDPLPPPHAAIDEGEAMSYLASMGASGGLLDKIKELMDKIIKRSKLLLALATALSALSLAVECLREELEAMEQERRDLEQDPAMHRRQLVG